MSHRSTARPWRLAVLAASVALLGCNKSPLGWALDFAPGPVSPAGTTAPNVVRTGTPTLAPSTPFPTLGSGTPGPGSPATATPFGASPEPTDGTTPGPEPSAIAADDPFPSPSTFSELDPAEQQQVEQVLASEEAINYLPSELIHDGGVVLFRTLAIGAPGRSVQQGVAPAIGPPPPWERRNRDGSVAQVALRKACRPGEACAQDRAGAILASVRYQQKGVFKAGATETKYGAVFSRTLVLKPKDGKPALAEVSPFTVTTFGGRRGLEIASMALFDRPREQPGAEVVRPVFEIRRDDLTVPVDQQPKLIGGKRGRLEVRLVNPRPEAFVFLSFPGRGAAARVQLLDNGQGPDRVAGDGQFSAEFPVPNRLGVHNAVADVIARNSFLPGTPFRMHSMGLSFVVDNAVEGLPPRPTATPAK